MSICQIRLRFGFTCILCCCATCGVNVAPTEPDAWPPLNATATDEPPDDSLHPGGIAEPVVLEVTAGAPICCDGYERVFEARIGAEVVSPPATCHWDFDDGRFADGCRVSHRFAWAGEYTPSVSVTMPDGTKLVGAVDVTVGYATSDPPDDGHTGVVQIEYLAGPEGDTAPGRYEVAWRFLDIGPHAGVQLRRGCCECPSADSQVLTPDAEGIYTTMVDIPEDRAAWYFVRYTLAGVEHFGSAIDVYPPLSRANAAPRSRVIWPFVGSRAKPESLAAALSSKLITDVAIFAGNRDTSDTLDAPQTQEAITIARREGVELILVRYLWPTQPGPSAELTTLFDVAHYVREIELLRQEADRIGAGSVGFDAETYGPTPLTDHFRAPDGFLPEDYDALVATIDEVVSQSGQVDFILPAGSVRDYHPYGALAALARKRISESTYYDNEQDIGWIPYSYDLAGMYLNVSKDHPVWPTKPYFLPSEMFGEKAYIWRRKEGLMIWPKEDRTGEVADLLAVFAGQCSANPNFR